MNQSFPLMGLLLLLWVPIVGDPLRVTALIGARRVQTQLFMN